MKSGVLFDETTGEVLGFEIAAGACRRRVVATVAAAVAGVSEVTRRLEAPLPMVANVDIDKALFETTPVSLTVTAAGERVPLVVPRHRVLTDHTLWERMHAADWNNVSPALRARGLDAMLARYSDLVFAPDRWDRMTAHDWDRVPQPIRALAYRHMVEYWAGFYALARLNDLPPGLVSDTLAAIVDRTHRCKRRRRFVMRSARTSPKRWRS
jgi:hypothetical protein